MGWISSPCRCRLPRQISLNPSSRRSIHKASALPILHIPKSSIYAFGETPPADPVLRDVSWTIQPNEAWAVLGSGSGSSKTALFEALAGHRRLHPPPPGGLFPFLQGRDSHDEVRTVSFAHRPSSAGGEFYDYTARYGAVRDEDKKTLRETFFPETARPLHKLAMPDLLKPSGESGPVADYEQERAKHEWFEELTQRLDLGRLLDLPVIALSNGQTRKARIAKALLQHVELLILDEPLTGLDTPTRTLLLSFLHALHTLDSPRSPHIILGMRIKDPLPDWISHIAVVRGDRTLLTGKKENVLRESYLPVHGASASSPAHEHRRTHGDEVIRISDLSVSYGPRDVLKSINWTIHRNSRWHLMGANGAGKTTLLAMLTGEHPQSYSQSRRLSLFGRPRSQWPTPQLNARIGRVSPEIHNAFPRRYAMTVWDAIGTGFEGGFVPRGRRRVGFFDGVDLQEGGELEQWRVSRMHDVLAALGPRAWRGYISKDAAITDEDLAFAKRAFVDLSPGEQSIVLLMRALVGQPPLVLLDEAWAGMDDGMVQAARRYLSGEGLTESQACVVVSHWEDEVPWNREDGVRRFLLRDGEGVEVS
ncbi:P-loop containing nucleoside triphosphate hydrolase protein [Obba rivulosa]|uniref:P-loop containing nucleoside triphosphate hydrolase protein n=1 Tax=Obba rivulosa TaxID=1052685 RepID=A0A8E2B1D7_9APHY|nr:P-loop containing nucleoside triphosphate hydrolase protein [Obba rivulosa]